MQVGLFAQKMGMTQIFDESGMVLPATILKTETGQITQIKTSITDGYNAVQLAYGKEKAKNINKPTKGHLKKIGDKQFKHFGEFRVSSPKSFKLGQVIKLDIFSVGQKVRVTGRSIGKGFAGNQKRHNFRRGPMTHGSKNHRLPGSIGAGTTPGRVYPGKKMAGQLGHSTITVKNTEILYINLKDNILVLKGSVPGKKNSILKIQH